MVDNHEDLSSEAIFFNDLEGLDPLHRPTQLAVWAEAGKILGIEVRYSNSVEKGHGRREGIASQRLSLAADGSEIIVELGIRQAVFTTIKGPSYIESIAAATSNYNVLNTAVSTDLPPSGMKFVTTTYVRAEDTRYSLRGFFGLEDKGVIVTLGVIWGKDGFVPVPSAPISTPLCRRFLDLSPSLRDKVKGYPKGYAHNFQLGGSLTCDFEREGATAFNSLDDINPSWVMSRIDFHCNTTYGALCGLKVTYANGRSTGYGNTSVKTKAWGVELGAILRDLVVVKMTAGKKSGHSSSWIDTLEFIKADDTRTSAAEGILPAWPLDLSSARFLGQGLDRVDTAVETFVEQAANARFTNGLTKWSIQGFYGEFDTVNDKFGCLGVIWGRS